jgi:hypothetical protein
MSASREPCARYVSSVANTKSLASTLPFVLSDNNKGDDGRAMETARIVTDTSKSDVRADDLDLCPASDSSSCFSYEDGVDDFDGPLWLDALSAESVAREAGLTCGVPNLVPEASGTDGTGEALTKKATQQHEASNLSSPRSVTSSSRTDNIVTGPESDVKQRRGRDRSIDAIIRSPSITENISYPSDDLRVEAHSIDHTSHKCSPLCGGRHVGQCAHVAGCNHGPYSSA